MQEMDSASESVQPRQISGKAARMATIQEKLEYMRTALWTQMEEEEERVRTAVREAHQQIKEVLQQNREELAAILNEVSTLREQAVLQAQK